MASDDFYAPPPRPRHSLPVSSDAAVSVSKASIEDWPSIAEVLLFHGLPAKGLLPLLHRFVVVRVDGVFAGSTAWSTSEEHLRIEPLTVVPERQRTGLGTRLLAELRTLAENKGLRAIVVEPGASSDFFARNGYRGELLKTGAPRSSMKLALEPRSVSKEAGGFGASSAQGADYLPGGQ